MVATVLLLLPMLAVGANLRMTAAGAPTPDQSVTLPFFVAGFSCYALFVALQSMIVFPSVNSLYHFTMVTSGLSTLVVGGMVTLTFFGAIYSVLPRLYGSQTALIGLRPVILWLSVAALGMIVTCALIGGMTQGFSMRDPGVTFIYSLKFAEPYRVMVAISELTLLAVNVMFATTLAVTLARPIVVAEKVSTASTPAVDEREVVSV